MISFHDFDPVLWPFLGAIGVRPCCVMVKEVPQDREEEMKSVPNESTIMVRDADNAILINGILANIKTYNVVVPDKVVQVFFYDGGKEKVVLKEGDTFDLNRGLLIATAKHVGREYYNLKGIEDIADRLSHLKCIDKMLNHAHRNHKQDEAQREAERLKKIEDLKRKAKAKARAHHNPDSKKVTVKSCTNCPRKDHKLNITKTKHGDK